MDHMTHSALLWIVVGSAVLAVFLWLSVLSSTVGRERDAALDRILSNGGADAARAGDTEPRIRSVGGQTQEPDRFRQLGDPEYGLFLEDAQPPGSAISAA
jgi:hypothetical protein